MNKNLLFTLVCMCFIGCDMHSGMLILKTGGITYEIPFQKQVAPDPGVVNVIAVPGTAPDAAPKMNSGFTFFGEISTLKEYNGHLTVNGKEFGIVKQGDTVHIDKNGKVSINSTPRNPQ